MNTSTDYTQRNNVLRNAAKGRKQRAHKRLWSEAGSTNNSLSSSSNSSTTKSSIKPSTKDQKPALKRSKVNSGAPVDVIDLDEIDQHVHKVTRIYEHGALDVVFRQLNILVVKKTGCNLSYLVAQNYYSIYQLTFYLLEHGWIKSG